MRSSFLLFIAIVLLCVAGTVYYVQSRGKSSAPEPGHGAIEQYVVNRLHYRARKLKDFAARNGYNTRVCLMADMRLYSGQNRFFVFDIDRDSIMLQGLVAHGRCNERWLEGRRYGNTVGCGCSSLGKYKVGQSYMGRFGLAYKLHGLDNTNSKAFERYVVLHAHECVPTGEVYPDPICQSDGCPTLSPPFLEKVSRIINSSDKPLLLLLFDE